MRAFCFKAWYDGKEKAIVPAMSVNDKSKPSRKTAQEVHNEYVAEQVQEAIAAAQLQVPTTQAPADQQQPINILNQLVLNRRESNTAAQARLDAQTTQKTSHHENIGTVPSKFKGDQSNSK